MQHPQNQEQHPSQGQAPNQHQGKTHTQNAQTERHFPENPESKPSATSLLAAALGTGTVIGLLVGLPILYLGIQIDRAADRIGQTLEALVLTQGATTSSLPSNTETLPALLPTPAAYDVPSYSSEQLLQGSRDYQKYQLGNPSAPAIAQVVLFEDPLCSYCRRLHLDTLRAFREFKGGHVNIVSRHFLVFGESSRGLAALIECAGKLVGAPGYQRAQEIVYNQAGTTTLDAIVQDVSVTLGRPQDELRSCMTSEATQAALDADQRIAELLHLTGTPAVFINGKQVGGYVTYAEWLQLLGLSTIASNVNEPESANTMTPQVSPTSQTPTSQTPVPQTPASQTSAPSTATSQATQASTQASGSGENGGEMGTAPAPTATVP